MFEEEPLRAGDMDTVGNLFAVRFVEREGLSPLVELYIEDDEYYHLKMSFDAAWLPDLEKVARRAIEDQPSRESDNA